MPESLFLVKSQVQTFSCEFCEISKNISYAEHLCAAASYMRKEIPVQADFPE